MAGSQALSEEEFHRMQAQLLELRTQNYQLSDDLRKNSTELNAVRQKNVILEKDFIKAQKALNKSKKAQEVDALLSETEMLQVKLHSQEEDFRLQNSTLMAELSKLCTQIEQLEAENQTLKEATLPSLPSSSLAEGELLRLQAENCSLINRLTDLQDPFDTELQRQAVAPGNESITTETDGSASANEVSDVTGKGAGPVVGTNERLGQSQDQLLELDLKLSADRDHRRLQHEEVSRLQEEVTKLSEKLRKKQDSFQRLQGEKEALYNDSRTKISEILQRKDEEVKSLNLRIQKLQADQAAANQVTAELKEQLQSGEKEYEVALHALKEQIQTVKTQEVNLLREQQEALTAELTQRRADQESLLAQRDDLGSQLQELSFSNRKLLEQLTDEGQEKDKLLRELEEARKTAEKRKSMLDDLAIQLNQEKSDHKEALSDLKLQHEKEVLGVRARYEKELRGLHEDKNRSEEEIRQQLRDEKARSREMEGLQLRVEELQAQLLSMEGTRGWFERRLKEAEENIEKKSLEHQDDMERLHKEYTLQLEVKEAQLEETQQQLVEVQKQKKELGDTIDKLKQEVKDTVDGQKIIEKKGSAALKDLKRQLQLERKRADKLQERLQEILRRGTGLEELVLSDINSPSRTQQQTGDSSSVSSFSYRDMMKEPQATTQSKSGGGSPQSQPPVSLSDDEVGELFQRLAEVQQEKWMLEERVKHLEVSCSSMAEDICRKSSIIETYVMDSRRDVSGGAVGAHGGGAGGERGGLGSVLRDLVKPGDENLREMNKKLQNMLEEQLTKNLHLSQDMETLSQELVRLSKDDSGSG